VRVFWNGEKLFTSQTRKVISIPPTLAKGLPNFAVEGELWPGYGKYDDINKLLNDGVMTSSMKLILFDIPTNMFVPFAEKLTKLKDILEVLTFVNCHKDTN
jgi:hypothetical protein